MSKAPIEDVTSTFEKMLDPQWAERYVDVLSRLGAAAKQFGPDAFKHLMAVEAQRIELESLMRRAEAREQTDLDIEKLKIKHELWKAQWNMRPFMDMDGRSWLIALAVIVAFAIAIWKA